MTESIEALTPLQLEILGILWERGQATSAEIREALGPERDLALSTVATLLSRLEKRKIVAHRRDGRQFKYSARVTRGRVRESHVRGLTESLFGGDATALVSHLIDRSEVPSDELERIRQLLERAGGAGE